MTRYISLSQKLQYCRSLKENFYEMWKQFATLDVALSEANKEQYFNRRHVEILKQFLNDNKEVSCNETIVEVFLEWLQKQPSVSNHEILNVFDPKTALIWDCHQLLIQGKPIDKKIRDKYIKYPAPNTNTR